jgi:UDP-N-acetylmuramoyl-tripeptide--D-alanyl-D-alanine ligase
VVGITGSTGKTSTKDLTAAALAPAGPVGASPVSFNNEIGVPLTLLSAPSGTVAVVVEMGARGIGHIATLAAVARPTIGVITNIGMAHAEFFGSREEVALGKGELVEALPAGGHAVLNADDDMTPGLRARTGAAVLTAGTSAGADVRFSAVQLDDELRPAFRLDTPWGSADVPPLPVRGAHQAANAAFAVAVAGVVGLGLTDALAGLAGATGSPLRMDLRRSPAGLIVLNDSYNANPTSMAAAVDSLAGLGAGRRFAVLGRMAELGPHATPEHYRLGKLVAAAGVETLVVVAGAPQPGGPGGVSSPELAALADGARENGVEALVVAHPEEAVDALTPRLRPGDAVLVKASRVAGLERVAAALLEWSTEPASEETGS